MPRIKISISIQQAFLQKTNALAREMKISRSHLFEIALEQFIRRRANEELLARLNAAYADEPDEAEKLFRQQVRRMTRRIWQRECEW